MPLQIKHIKIGKIGPLKKIDERFKPLTVIYAKNEKGKTTIVENIIARLFGKKEFTCRKGFISKLWSITLGYNKSEIILDKEKPGKLETLLEKDNIEFPSKLHNLFIVKGADTGILKDNKKMKAYVSELFSDHLKYKKIQEKLTTEGISRLDINSYSKGKIDTTANGTTTNLYSAKLENYKSLSELIDGYSDLLSSSHSLELSNKEKILEKAKDEILRRKYYKAYTLNKRIQELEKILSVTSPEDVQEVRDKIINYMNIQSSITGYASIKGDIEQIDSDIDWLNECLKKYEKYKNFIQIHAFIKWFPVSTLISVIFSLVMIFISKPVLFYMFSALSIICAAASIFSVKSKIENANKIHSLEDLKNDLENRFKVTIKSLTNIDTSINSKIKSLKEEKIEMQGELRGYDNQKIRLESLKDEINKGFLKFSLGIPKAEDWLQAIDDLKKQNDGNQTELTSLRPELKNLYVAEEDFINVKVPGEYSYKEETEILGQISETSKQIEDIKNKHNDTRNEFTKYFEKDDIKSWNDEQIIINSNKMLDSMENGIKDDAAALIGVSITNGVIKDILSKEDKILKTCLESDEIKDSLKQMTGGRYVQVFFSGDKTPNLIIVNNDKEVFEFDNLSTGAQEQVMLALRIGIIKKLTGENTMFLILDDAFQHSDWGRREILIDNVMQLVNQGWQVIYLTMDDDIRDRFNRIAAQKIKKDEYRPIPL